MGQHPEEQQPHYLAFISYNRKDEKWAKILQRQLESYRLPSSVCKNRTIHEKRLQPIFRDKTGIKPSILSDELRGKLDDSQYLITICSPNAVKSDWMGMGIEHFVNTGKKDNIIAYIVKGEPYSNDSDNECYHDKLKQYFPKCQDLKQDRQLLGVNINEAGNENRFYKRERASIQIVSKMLDLPFEDLWRHQRRRIISMLCISIFFFLGLFLSFFGVWAYNTPFDAKVHITNLTNNFNLPTSSGMMYLRCQNMNDSCKVNDPTSTIVFNNIPGKYKNKDVIISLKMFGFKETNIKTTFSKDISMKIERDDTWGIYQGYVYDADDFSPLADVTISIEGEKEKTDSSGYYKIIFPLSKQTITKLTCLEKRGYKTLKLQLEPSKSSSQKLILEKE